MEYFAALLAAFLGAAAGYWWSRLNPGKEQPLAHNGGKQSQFAALEQELELERAQRSAVESSAARQRALFERLLVEGNTVFVAADETGRIILFSAGAERKIGYCAAEAVGASIDILVPPADSGQLYEDAIALQRLIYDEQQFDEPVKSLIRRRDGSQFPAEVCASSLCIDGQKIRALVLHDVTRHRLNEERLRRSLREKDVLIREIHHRVKNNLQIIYSLLNLQSRGTADESALTALKESQSRIKSISLIYETLYQAGDLVRVDFEHYAQNLLNSLSRSFKTKHRLVLEQAPEGSRYSLDLDAAVPCGLIINELVTNSLKHAFQEVECGEVRTRLTKTDEITYVLTVKDNGCGFPADISFTDPSTLGLRLVTNLTKQLNGTIQFTRDPGSQVQIAFQETRL